MAALDELENDVIEIIGFLTLIVIVVMVLLAWAAWKKVSLPGWAYPDQLWGNFSTGVDTELSGVGLDDTSLKNSVDHWLGGIFGWIVDNLPNTPKSKLPQSDSDDPAEADTGGQ